MTTSPAIVTMLVVLAGGAVALLGFLVYVWLRYSPIIGRIFEETPVFAPLRVAPEPGGEAVRFTADDGIELAGTYFPTDAETRLGVIVFCPEYLGARWSALPYTEGLREAGFDVFTFDFRNHGDSDVDPTYNPLQWVSDLELTDLRAALEYLRRRPDRDPAGVGVFGVSRGGGTALVAAADDPTIWAVASDGAFPTRGTVLAYILRWAEIYVGSKTIWRRMPQWMFAFVGWSGRISTQRRLGRKYPDLERAVARLSPRPWLMIHGEKDAYIGPEIARDLYAKAGSPKEAWFVPGAKHNRCREADPATYRERLVEFFRHYAPRRPVAIPESTAPARVRVPLRDDPQALAGAVAEPISG